MHKYKIHLAGDPADKLATAPERVSLTRGHLFVARFQWTQKDSARRRDAKTSGGRCDARHIWTKRG